MSNSRNQLSTGEDRTKVILSTCESSSYREFRNVAVDTTDALSSSRRKCSCPSRPLTTSRCTPFRRRVSFCDAAVIGAAADDHCRVTIMQDDDIASSRRDNDRKLENNEDQKTFYDIWQADDSSAGRSDDGYSESMPRLDNYAENRSVSSCTSSKGQRSHPENIDEQIVENDGDARERWDGKSAVCPANRIAENKTRRRKVGEDTMLSEDLSSASYKNIDSISCDRYRMRGGCGACCCGTPNLTREKCVPSVRRSLQDCCCEGSVPESNKSCAFSSDAKTACTVRCCYHCPQICKKVTRCDVLPCTIDVQSCGGCRKSGQICTAHPRTYNSPAHSSRGRSPCAPRCPPQSSCPASGCRSCCSGVYECGRSRSPRCQSTVSSGYCINNGTKCGTDGACCRLRLLCDCLGGGLDCRRCGRKVYQAEMQIASGVPYHSICFSCFCCRKPLEPLTYQENCGEIYCKQCYVRNFGPQGYGYGAGAGVLQTPL